jgi:PPOX class probable F420-dependent enzyme
MDRTQEAFVLGVMKRARDLTLATVREDGYPQATTVSFASDGLKIYVGTGRDSQKVCNIRRCPKVSLTMDLPYQDWDHIRGLSMAARAEILDDPDEIRHAADCLLRKFPVLADMSGMMDAQDMAFVRITPEVISVLDYAQGFGHTELVEV